MSIISYQIGQMLSRSLPCSILLIPIFAVGGIASRQCVSADTKYVCLVVFSVIWCIVASLPRSASIVVRLHKCGGMPYICICICFNGLPEVRAEVLWSKLDRVGKYVYARVATEPYSGFHGIRLGLDGIMFMYPLVSISLRTVDECIWSKKFDSYREIS